MIARVRCLMHTLLSIHFEILRLVRDIRRANFLAHILKHESANLGCLVARWTPNLIAIFLTIREITGCVH